MLTAGQKRAVHAAAREAGLDEEQRRLVQRNVGGFSSCADRTAGREGFIAVMAFLEARAGGRLRGCTPNYWAEQDRLANPLDALRWRIRREAAAMGWLAADVDRLLASRHMSDGAYVSVEHAPAYWLSRLLTGLVMIRKRREAGVR